jgi:hypothetical protein
LTDKLRQNGLRVVYRPHPGDLPCKESEVELDGRFNIAPWIKACTLLINAKCTTSFEAFLARKPCLTFPLESREYFVRFANLFARKINPDDSIKNLLKSKPLAHPQLDRVAQANVAYAEKPARPIELISDALAEMAFPSKGKPRFWQCSYLFDLRNSLAFRLRGDDYGRVTRKFPIDELKRVHQKFLAQSIQAIKKGKMLILKSSA